VEVPPAAVEILPAPPKPAPAPVARGLVQIAAPASIAVGQQFYVDVKAGDVQGVAAAPFTLAFNPQSVDFVSATEGTFMKRDGAPTQFSATAANGLLTVNVSRPGAATGVSGNGTLVSALFKAKNKGPASFGFRNVSFTTVDGKPLEILPFSTSVDVR
jgi:general secretion pathway protein D